MSSSVGQIMARNRGDPKMPIKYLIVAGAGCTRSDAMQKPARQQPPLDRRFFKNCTKARYAELDIVKNYLRETYDYDPDEQERDSLEAVMAILYTDIHNSQLEPKAVEAFPCAHPSIQPTNCGNDKST
jgi:hypothetical protein